MRILIVKHTSMGDLVQALPALSDAQAAIPELTFDWVADEQFAEIPEWHSAVSTVIPSALRRWRKQPFSASSRRELVSFRRRLRNTHYDHIIDAQGNLKSAITTAFARGTSHGLDRHSAREAGASWMYSHRHAVERKQLAVNRWRQLFASSLHYAVPDTVPDFGLDDTDFPAADFKVPNQRHIVFIHNASWQSKLWPESHWRDLMQHASSEGLQVLLPWGNKVEQQAAQTIAAGFDHALVLPKLNLSNLAALLQSAEGAVCTDTGLAHLSAALGTPTVTVYGPTDPMLIGATGPNSIHAAAVGYSCAPCYKRNCDHPQQRQGQAQCLKNTAPQRIWQEFRSAMNKGKNALGSAQ